jgi:hypothetical protein
MGFKPHEEKSGLPLNLPRSSTKAIPSSVSIFTVGSISRRVVPLAKTILTALALRFGCQVSLGLSLPARIRVALEDNHTHLITWQAEALKNWDIEKEIPETAKEELNKTLNEERKKIEESCRKMRN